jgi:group I intron endonuclease
MKRWTIYRISNPQGAVYIGCTSNFYLRMASYKSINSSLNGQRALSDSFKAFGFDNHTIDIIEEFEGVHLEAESKEIFWIRTYMSNRNKWPNQGGLNLTNGGKGAFGHTGSFKGQKRPPEVGEKISIAWTGKKLSAHHKQRLSEGKKGKPSNNRKPVIQYDLNGTVIKIHASIKEAAEYINGSSSGVHRVSNGEYDVYKGYKFKYK